jgi:hypothetical protein
MMHRSSFTLLVRAGVAAAALAAASSHALAATVIDDFDAFQALSISAGTPSPASAQDGIFSVDVLGGARNLALTQTTGRAGASMLVDAGILSTSLGSSTNGTFTVLWDGGIDSTPSFSGLGGVDLTGGGANDRFVVRARSDGLAPVTVTVYNNGSGTPYSQTFILPGGGFGATPFTAFELPFSAFAAATFDDIGAIMLAIDATAPSSQGTDAELDIILATTAIPEPPAIALLVGGLGMGFLMFRRRMRHF